MLCSPRVAAVPGRFRCWYPVTAQGLLVFAAVALTATATYAALRLETVSQLDSTAAQLSARISETSGTALMIVSASTSRMLKDRSSRHSRSRSPTCCIDDLSYWA